MTEQEIDQMEAGDEMDALIGEKIFGHTVDRAGEVIRREILDGPRAVYFNEDRSGYTACPKLVPFSTDIAATWRVVERMAAIVNASDNKLQYLSLEHCGQFEGFAASFGLFGGDDETEWWDHPEDFPASAKGETAPLAICRAALKTTLHQEAV